MWSYEYSLAFVSQHEGLVQLSYWHDEGEQEIQNLFLIVSGIDWLSKNGRTILKETKQSTQVSITDHFH